MVIGYATINEIFTFFRKIYCSYSLSVEYMHISDPAEKGKYGLEKTNGKRR